MFDMYLKYWNVLWLLAFKSVVSAGGPIIEVPADYDRAAPWNGLATLNLKNLTGTDCQRTCVVGAAPRVCFHTFILENYAAMGTACGNCSRGVINDCFRSQCIRADGKERGVESINRQIPGPSIHVCKNDLVVIKVNNRITGTSLTLHWHGVLQKQSQWMDGVPRVTQCAIGSGETFVYSFFVKEAGTMIYHSHTGQQKMNGIYGAMIIREPIDHEPWPANTYTTDLEEHEMMISDWMHDYAEMYTPGLPSREPGDRPTSILINGLGWYRDTTEIDETYNASIPLATFHFQRNQRHRLRIIHGGTMYCPFQIQIEGHLMEVIATDGHYVTPVTVKTLVLYSGERFDVSIDTHNVTDEKDEFWIHVRALGICETLFKLDGYGIVSYGTKQSDLGIVPPGRRPTVSQPLPIETILNHPNTTCGASRKRLCVSDLQAIGDDIDKNILTATPDVQIFARIGRKVFNNVDQFHQEGNYHRFSNPRGNVIDSMVINDISFVFLPIPTLFIRDKDPGFCNPDKLPAICMGNSSNPTEKLACECMHFVTIKQNAIVELIIIEGEGVTPGINHVMHLHGYRFYVAYVGQDLTKSVGYTDNEVREALNQKNMSSSDNKLHIPSVKDTVLIPTKGLSIVRLKTDNPGDWLLHCHFDSHAINGMVMGFRVEGEIPDPPLGFQRCAGFNTL